MANMRIGLIGCGNIASDICRAIHDRSISAEIVALCDINASQAEMLRDTYQLNALIGTIQDVVASVDLVVECAGPSVVSHVVEAAMVYHIDCLIMSVGGLLQDPSLLETARERGINLHVPSGAICGIDGIRNAMQAGLDEVTLTTRKPIKGLKGAPYLLCKGIELDGLTEAQVIFDGSAREAVKAFPNNVNVAATLSLAGLGADQTRVRVIADPSATANTHEIRAKGAFGELTVVISNLPSPRNPKSSYMASLSACAEVAAAAKVFATRVS
ncbi:MAG: aspartate dehydrogenase [Candidatus Hydrogenedentes bacterium]|jgi:aspartate dehydrogenase|nr:aspartate dehydrogenase [Candidatus Hydrogenedentota bacterium]